MFVLSAGRRRAAPAPPSSRPRWRSVVAGARHPTVLVDLGGDLPAVLGMAEPPGPGVAEWLGCALRTGRVAPVAGFARHRLGCTSCTPAAARPGQLDATGWERLVGGCVGPGTSEHTVRRRGPARAGRAAARDRPLAPRHPPLLPRAAARCARRLGRHGSGARRRTRPGARCGGRRARPRTTGARRGAVGSGDRARGRRRRCSPRGCRPAPRVRCAPSAGSWRAGERGTGERGVGRTAACRVRARTARAVAGRPDRHRGDGQRRPRRVGGARRIGRARARGPARSRGARRGRRADPRTRSGADSIARHPIVDARLPDGSRVCAVVPPVAVDGPCLAVRRFGVGAVPLGRFAGATSSRLLRQLVAARCNVARQRADLVGQDHAAQRAGGRGRPDGERLITLEDTAELRLAAAHVVRLETRPRLTGRRARGRPRRAAAHRAASATRPAGRRRDPRRRGARARPGAQHRARRLARHHPRQLPRSTRSHRLESLVVQASPAWSLAAVRDQVRRSVDVVVHVARDEVGSRGLTAVAEVEPRTGDQLEVRLLADRHRVVAPLVRRRR